MIESRVQLAQRLGEISVNTVEAEVVDGKWKHIRMDRILVLRRKKGIEIYL